jgi:hypothetical protein
MSLPPSTRTCTHTHALTLTRTRTHTLTDTYTQAHSHTQIHLSIRRKTRSTNTDGLKRFLFSSLLLCSLLFITATFHDCIFVIFLSFSYTHTLMCTHFFYLFHSFFPLSRKPSFQAYLIQI